MTNRAINDAIRERFPLPKKVAVHFKAALADLYDGPYSGRMVAEANSEYFPNGYSFSMSVDVLNDWIDELPWNVIYNMCSGYVETDVNKDEFGDYVAIELSSITKAIFGKLSSFL